MELVNRRSAERQKCGNEIPQREFAPDHNVDRLGRPGNHRESGRGRGTLFRAEDPLYGQRFVPQISGQVGQFFRVKARNERHIELGKFHRVPICDCGTTVETI